EVESAPRGATIEDMSLREVLAARASGALAIDDGALAALGLDRARASDEDWSLVARDLPDSLKEAALERARRTPRGAERANLLTWLEEHGVERATLVDIALAPVADGKVSYGVVGWLARLLSTRASWEKLGQATMSALMQA